MSAQTAETIQTRRAPVSAAGASSSWDEGTRTFRAVIATATPVRRRDWDGDEYLEILDAAGVVLAGSVPLLNSHRSSAVSDVIGKLERVERVGDRLEAVIRLSRRADVEGLAQDVADGVVDSVSAGYVVHDWLDETAEDGTRTKTAVRWTLIEMSAVPVPADPNAKIRGKVTVSTEVNDENETPRQARTARVPREQRAATETEIRAYAQQLKLPDSFVNEQIERGVSMQAVRNATIDYLEATSVKAPLFAYYADPGVDGGRANLSNPTKRVAIFSEALASRALPDLTPSDPARQFVGLTLPELARSWLSYADVDVRGLSAGQVVQRALGGLHGTSDFSHVLSGAIDKVLRHAYEAAPSGLKPLARRLELNDFRTRTVAGLSGLGALEKVSEHGEYTRTTITDSGETIRLATYGKVFGITRQALINDDLGAFADIPRKLGLAAAQFEAAQLAALLASNPAMGDAKTLFHADHKNVGTAGAPGVDTLSDARKKMRTQTDEAGNLIGIAPKWLVVGPELETDADKLMASITAASIDEVQPIRLAVAVEPRLTGKTWFVAADPATCDGLAYAHLAAEAGPQTFSRVGFDIDGIEFKVRLDFGCAFLDWRSWFRNAGA